MSYLQLVDIGLNVDTTALEQKLDEIEQKLSAVEPVDEDQVHDLIASYVSAENIMDSDDVDRAIDDKLDGYVSSDDLEQAVDDRLEGYLTEEQVKELAHDEGVITEGGSEWSDLVQRVESLEGEDNESIDGLKQRVTTLEQGLNQDGTIQDKVNEALENGNFASDSTVEDLGERMAQQDARIDTLLAHIKSLEEQVKAQDSAIDGLQAQVEQLTLKMGETLERSDTALSFFKLIKQAFALLQRGA